MKADNYDNMMQLAKMTLDEWTSIVTPHQAWVWFNDLVSLVKAIHYEIDKTDVMFCEGDLRQRMQWLRERLEAAEEVL